MSSGIESVQARRSTVSLPPPETFSINENVSQTADATAASPQKFGEFEQWSKTSARAEVDSFIRQNGGGALSAQDMELLRRHVFLKSQAGGDAAGTVGDVLKQLSDPQNGQANRAQLWADQATMFGGRYLDRLPEDLKARAESLVRLPGAASPPQQSATPAPGSSSETTPPSSNQPARGNQQVVAAPPSSGQALNLPPDIQKIIEAEFNGLKGDDNVVTFSDIEPLFKKLNLPDDYAAGVRAVLANAKKDENNIGIEDYAQIRLYSSIGALGQMIKSQSPNISDKDLEQAIAGGLQKFFEATR